LWNSLQQEALPCSDVAIIMRCTFIEQKLKFCIDVFAFLINGKRGGGATQEATDIHALSKVIHAFF
jgi:hypothetical protein